MVGSRVGRKRRSGGFGLIEQIMAIAVAGAASAVALPQLAELQPLADAAALSHLGQAANSAMQINFGACLVTDHQPVAGKCRPVRDCADLGTLLQGDVPEGYRVLPMPLGQGTRRSNGDEGRCTIEHLRSGALQGFGGIAAGQ